MAAKFRKKPIVIEATQWFKNGDHPKDDCNLISTTRAGEEPFLSEGKVVRYFRHPEVRGEKVCMQCHCIMHEHGWIDTKEGGHIVCPGDFIITGIRGEYYPCKPDIFEDSYEAVPETSHKAIPVPISNKDELFMVERAVKAEHDLHEAYGILNHILEYAPNERSDMLNFALARAVEFCKQYRSGTFESQTPPDPIKYGS